MTLLHLDPLGGIAGDMTVAALLDLRPDAEGPMRAALAALPLLESVTVALVGHDDGILTGRRFEVRRADDGHHHGHHHGHGHGHHDHVHWATIRDALIAAPLAPAVRDHALSIFTHLAEAEGRVHGRPPEAVTFHEVGAWDSIADILATAALLAELGVTGATCAALPLGGGRVRTAHGPLPVPAPATALLLEGFDTIDDGIGGERVTPTGAAILRHLCATPVPPGPRRLTGSGHGFGTRTLPGLSNVLRVLAFETAATGTDSDRVAVLECEIDDQSGEDLALGLARLRAHPGVIDVLQMAGFGKKGRMVACLRVLARPEAEEAVAQAIFAETTTLGLRHGHARRSLLPRREARVETAQGPVRVKRAERPGGDTTKAEADDLAGHPAGLRASLRREAEG